MPRWAKGSKRDIEKCDICEKEISNRDYTHISTHTPLDLVTCWVKWEFLSNDEMEKCPDHLYDLRKYVLQQTDIAPGDVHNPDVLARWLDRHGIPFEIVKL